MADSAIGLHRSAPYYAPADGRFLSPDAYPYVLANPIELNRYVYTANNPVNWSDPSGQMAETAARYQAISAAWPIFATDYQIFIGATALLIVGYLLQAQALAGADALPFPPSGLDWGEALRRARESWEQVWGRFTQQVREEQILLWLLLTKTATDALRYRLKEPYTIVDLGSGTMGLWARALKAMHPAARVIATEQDWKDGEYTGRCRLLKLALMGSGVEVVCDWNTLPDEISDQSWLIAPPVFGANPVQRIIEAGREAYRITKSGGSLCMVVSQAEIIHESEMKAILVSIAPRPDWVVIDVAMGNLPFPIPSEVIDRNTKIWFSYLIR